MSVMSTNGGYKVCILAAGITKRVGDVADFVNKAIIPVNNRGVISYLIEKFPPEVEIVVAVGHRKESLKEYLRFAYPERTFTFVDIERYVGEWTGPATTLLECRDHLQCPFVICTADTIVLERIPAPTENWFGISPIPSWASAKQYCTVRLDGTRIERIDDKVGTDNTHAFIGIAAVKDYQGFFLALQTREHTVMGERQLSAAFQELLSGPGLAIRTFTWFDTGSINGFREANEHFTPKGAFDFSKSDEFLYFVNGRVLKFFADQKVTQNRIVRADILAGLCPEITGKGKNFYAYKFIPGQVIYDNLSPTIVRAFYEWAHQKVWTPKSLTIEEQTEFEVACRKFYKDKTLERIKKFYEKTGLPDRTVNVNGEKVAPLAELLERLNWEKVYDGKPGRMHGDLHFDNTIVKEGTTDEFVLLDWRQDFAGLLTHGDVYYDLGKIYGGTILSYKDIKQNKFSIEQEGENVVIDTYETSALRAAREEFERFARAHGYDLVKIRQITALIFLNMAPLHNAPFDRFLYYLGRRELQRAIS